MPVITGVEVMELQPNRPITIVTTAYSDFALSAFQNDAVDYLLKPISFEKFSKAIEKARAYYIGSTAKNDKTPANNILLCKVNGEATEISLSDIIYIESDGNYLKIYREKSKFPTIIYGTLLNISADIKNADFIQVHRTYIVNKAFIKTVRQVSLTLLNDIELPIGRKYRILLSGI